MEDVLVACMAIEAVEGMTDIVLEMVSNYLLEVHAYCNSSRRHLGH